MADTGTDTRVAQSHEVHQDVDFDEDDILAALVLGGDLGDVADIDRSVRTESDFERDVDFDDDDLLAMLVLGNGGGFGGGFGSSSVILDDGFDDDLGSSDFESLDSEALDFDTFGSGISSIADIDSSTFVEAGSERNIDFDDDDVLLALALG